MATIVKRKDRYHVVYDYINKEGQRKQRWKAFRTKREATAYKKTIESNDPAEQVKENYCYNAENCK